MKVLISKQAAIDAVWEGCGACGDLIEQILGVDAVEVIRCKDCKHFHENVYGNELFPEQKYEGIIVGHNACDKWSKDKDMNYTSPNGYCFLAERKDDGKSGNNSDHIEC